MLKNHQRAKRAKSADEPPWKQLDRMWKSNPRKVVIDTISVAVLFALALLTIHYALTRNPSIDPLEDISLETVDVVLKDTVILNEVETEKSTGIVPKPPITKLPESELPTEKHPEIASKPKKGEFTEKYISYRQGGGRINNQLVAFEAMIQFALYYNRILIIPWPRHYSHVMGWEAGLWDLERLREIIDFVMEDQIPSHLKWYLEKDWKEAPEAKACSHDFLLGKQWKENSQSPCEILYISGAENNAGTFVFPDGQHNVLQYMIPSQYIRKAVEDWLMLEFGELKYRLGVHRRAMNDGHAHPRKGEIHICRWDEKAPEKKLTKYVRQYLESNDKIAKEDHDDVFKEIMQMYRHSCAMDWYDLENILVFHRQEAIKKGETFFIAHDHQEPQEVDKIKSHFGRGIEQSEGTLKFSSWTKSEEAFQIHSEKCKEFKYCATAKVFANQEQVLFDMWALTYADFLVGSWMSTLTRNVCHWKGVEASMYNGNMCFLRTKWKDTADGKNDQWFSLQGLNKDALFDPSVVTPFIKF